MEMEWNGSFASYADDDDDDRPHMLNIIITITIKFYINETRFLLFDGRITVTLLWSSTPLGQRRLMALALALGKVQSTTTLDHNRRWPRVSLSPS